MNEILQALNTPRRREILRLLWTQELRAGDIHRAQPDVTFGAVSQHLAVLERAGLVAHRRDGVQRYYSARKDHLGPLRGWLESMWDSALYRLKLKAELEQAKRGPHPGKKARRRK